MQNTASVKVSPRLLSGLAKILPPQGEPSAAEAKLAPRAHSSGVEAEWRHRRRNWLDPILPGPGGNPWGPLPSPWDPSSYAASQVATLSDQLQGASQTLSQAMDARQSQVSWLGSLFDPAMWSMRQASWSLGSAQSATSSALADLEGQGGWSGGPQDASSKLTEAQSQMASADRSLYDAQMHLAQSNPYAGYDNTGYWIGSARQGIEAGYQEASSALGMLGSPDGPMPYAMSAKAVGKPAPAPVSSASSPRAAAAILSQAIKQGG